MLILDQNETAKTTMIWKNGRPRPRKPTGIFDLKILKTKCRVKPRHFLNLLFAESRVKLTPQIQIFCKRDGVLDEPYAESHFIILQIHL